MPIAIQTNRFVVVTTNPNFDWHGLHGLACVCVYGLYKWYSRQMNVTHIIMNSFRLERPFSPADINYVVLELSLDKRRKLL